MPFEETTRSGAIVLHPSEPTRNRVKSGQPYPDDLRARVIAAIEQGASYRQAAARHGVSASAALKWAHRFRQTGSVAARPMGGDRRSYLKR
jgi:transposase